jgi:hypothetical protein
VLSPEADFTLQIHHQTAKTTFQGPKRACKNGSWPQLHDVSTSGNRNGFQFDLGSGKMCHTKDPEWRDRGNQCRRPFRFCLRILPFTALPLRLRVLATKIQFLPKTLTSKCKVLKGEQ